MIIPYLGEQYAKEDNIVIKTNKKGVEQKQDLPIISIYFLGHNLEHTDASVIKVNRNYIDIIEGKEITKREEFIESLTHDSYVIQISKLKGKRRNELEILLSIFDQSNIEEDHHILNVKEEDFPKKYRIIIRRLQKAISEKIVRKTMDVEDEILAELENKERAIAKKELVIEEKNKIIEEKDKALEEKDKEIEELKRKLEQLKVKK
ncbi:MAG: hypothetical protein HQK76_01120 [Desulfobacterales bacterium]|nr:hypothetical protein [Desulfobacterales bacterium]